MLEIQTGCRIHFGLMELAQHAPLRFGGLGLSLEEPGFRIAFSHQAAECDERAVPCSAKSEAAARIDEVLQRRQGLIGPEPAVHVEVHTALPLHGGLGGGTQLGAAVAAGLELLAGFRTGRVTAAHSSWSRVSDAICNWDLARLAEYSGRGLRSAIGLQAFLQGGCVLDEGYPTHDSAQRRAFNCHSMRIPEDWRVVLIQPECSRRIHGASESALLEEIGARPNPDRDRMYKIATQIFAMRDTSLNFVHFTDLLSEYMNLGATMFRTAQGGTYSSLEAQHAVRLATDAGLHGVGQSSWGPTLFGFAPDAQSAQRSIDRLHATLNEIACDVFLSRPARRGARWRVNGAEPADE